MLLIMHHNAPFTPCIAPFSSWLMRSFTSDHVEPDLREPVEQVIAEDPSNLD
jgi:hypothetical protein